MSVSTSFQATADAENPRAVITTKDRRLQLAKLFVIAFVSIGTVTLTIVDVIQTAKSFDKKKELTYKIQGSIDTAVVIHDLQKERGLTAILFGFNQLKSKEERIELQELRGKTNESIAMLGKRDDADLSSLADGKSSFRIVLENFRRKIDEGKADVIEHLHTYRKWITKLIHKLAQYTESENLEENADLVYAYQMVILSKEEAGMERALGGLIFTQGNNFSSINTTWYTEKRVLAENYLKTSFLFSSELKEIYSTLFANASILIQNINEKRDILSRRFYVMSSKSEALDWFALMTKYNNLLLKLQIRQADLIEVKVKEEIDESTSQLVIRSLLLCFTLIVVPCIIVSLGRAQKSFYEYTLSLYDKVGLEQARTDFLMRENARHVVNLAERWKGFSNSSVGDH